MKKFYTAFFILLLSFSFHRVMSQALTFSFTGCDGNEASWPSSTQAPGVLPSSISRGAGVTASATGDRFNSKDWTTNSALDLNDYIEFTIIPQAGFSVTLSDITLQHQRSLTGPRSFVIRTSLDGFAVNATNVVNIADVNTNQVSVFSFPSVTTVSAPITIRIYAYNSETTGGTWGPGQSGGNDIVVSGALILLPVRFVNIKAVQKNNSIETGWTNLTEKDILYYSIERSSNGQEFIELAKINAIKNNGLAAEYLFLDTRVVNPVNFYRIKAVETSGSFLYSNIIKIETGVLKTGVSLYPNPAVKGTQTAMQMSNLPKGTYTLRVYNASAQLMHSEMIVSNGGSANETLFLGNWQKGMYILEISGSIKLQKQFIIQ